MSDDWERRPGREEDLNERARDFLKPPEDDPPDNSVPIDPPEGPTTTTDTDDD